ncbi:tyrosine-type recombinase/integrase [Lysinibacillus sp. CNPSo 3705]|uniref:tyrosine-type recombinase/integrase n=1 Tax=Lysinibacillus sp. CNPSo 3705 TaxID=3028148 RepID=UPI002363E7C9|nr:tyrosine-type recombinase/integrase [Lysinibacillus sp. CNPSo 3705]MDD1504568.1 tyrosine-type recombinase/integrase [Lysinibacillus sp. CNPSo 3705]
MSNSNLMLVDYIPNQTKQDFRCGNNSFSENLWDFKGFVDNVHWADNKFRLNFTKFSQWKEIQTTIKQYIVSELLMVTFGSVKRKYDAFNPLVNFLNQNNSIQSFADFSKATLNEYFNYLFTLNLSSISIKKSAQVLKELIVRGTQRKWFKSNVGKGVECLYDELILRNKGIKEGTKFGKTNKVLPSETVVNKIIDIAKGQLNDEKDILVAASIILMSQLGLRISECITLEAGCLSVINGEYQIRYRTSKTTKTAISVTKPANELVVSTIQRLEEHSTSFRKKTDSKYLFLMKSRNKANTIQLASFSNWTDKRLKPFIQKHDIRDENGQLIHLTAHYFRHIFATYALKSGMKLQDVAEMMNHKSIMMTETYDHTKGNKQEIIKEILTGEIPVTSTNKIVLESIEGEENPFKGLTTNQVDKMRKALKIELLPHGLCLHHPMRGEPCKQDGICLGCNEFLASAEYLPIYEKRLDKVQRELNILDTDKNIYTTKLRYQLGMLEKYVSDLKRKIAKKEDI